MAGTTWKGTSGVDPLKGPPIEYALEWKPLMGALEWTT